MTYEILPTYEQDSPEWHEARMQGIGASDVAAVLGLSPWQTPLSIYMAKMGVRNEIPENLAFFGHALEQPIADWIEHAHPELGVISPGTSMRSVEWPWLTATLDRQLMTDYETACGQILRIPIELKTSSAFSKDKWVDGVPLYYAAQVQQQCFILDAPYGWLAVLHGGNEPELYKVVTDWDFITEHLIPKTQEFWEQHVLTKTPPDPVTSAEAAELWPGNPEVTVEGDERLYELWGAYGQMQAEQVELAGQLDGIKLELQKAMKDAVALTYRGRELFTWRPRAGSKRFDDKAFREDFPHEAEKYMKQGTPTRVFSRKTVKEVEG